MRNSARRNDGEVVGNLGVVENALRGFDPIALERFARVLILDLAQRRFDRRDIVLGQIPRIGPRVGNDFVAFVELLRDLQSTLGAEAARVRVPLQTGEIVK